jgi:O-methyltransferase
MPWRRIKNSWWHTHRAFNSMAKLAYANAYDLPDEIGTFDIALMGAVLLHTRAPLQIVEQCAKRSTTVIIADRYIGELEGQPVCRLIPTAENEDYHSWWDFSTTLFAQFLGVMGFVRPVVTTYADPRGVPLFTLTADRSVSSWRPAPSLFSRS